MKKKSILMLITALTLTPLLSMSQSETFDSELAQKLKADDYGMKKFVIAFLYAGDRASEYTPEQRSEIQKGHMANINKLAEMDKLILAGPFFGNEAMRGIFVFAVES